MSDRLRHYLAMIDEYLAIVLAPGPAWASDPRRVELSDAMGEAWKRLTHGEDRAQRHYQQELYARRVYGLPREQVFPEG